MHSHIESIYRLFKEETNPFRKVHRMIDLSEVIIKTHTVVIISDYFRHKKISDDVKGLLAEGLRVPSLGTWQFFSRKVLKEMAKQNLATFIPGFIKYFEKWSKKHVDTIISVRNKYAHGVTPSDGDCAKDIEKYFPILNEWLESEWLKKTKINFPEKETEHVYLINEKGEKLDLFPLLTVKEIEKNNISEKTLVFFNDLKRKKEVSYLSYPHALHLRDKEIYTEFQRVIKTEEWKKKTTDEFKERIEELTEVFKGRVNERKMIKEWITKHNKGWLFIYGNPGVGKSALIAQTFKDLKSKKKKEIELIEYFIRRGTDHSKPGRILTYLSKRLESMFKTGVDIGITNDEMKEKLYERLRRISEIDNRKKIVIFIDGLDEGSENKILEYIINDTYKDVLVIYSARWTDEVESFYNKLAVEHKRKEEIKGLREEDIRAILYEVTDKYAITKEQVNEIAEKSQGNPLYIKMLTLAIEEGDTKLEDGITLPNKIEEFYDLFIKRYSKLEDGDNILRSLYTLAVAKDYLSQKQLEDILDFGSATTEKVISSLQEVLYEKPTTEGEGNYQLFHESLREYLFRKKKSNLEHAERKIIEYCRKWQDEIFNDQLLYSLKHYAEHLYNQGKKEELFDLINNVEFRRKQIEMTEQYDSGFKMVELGLKTWENEPYKLIEIGIVAAKLHLETKNSLEQIKSWINECGMENYRKALERIKNYEEKDRVILYFMLLNKAADNESKEVVELVVNEMDNNLAKDTSILKLEEILPLNYIVIVTSKIDEEYWGVVIDRVEKVKIEGVEKLFEARLAESAPIIFLKLSEKITNKKDKSVALINISTELAKQGKLQEASEVLAKALSVAEKISHKLNKSEALVKISTELAKQGKLKKAVAVAQKITDGWRKSEALLEISTELSRQGKLEKAAAVAEKITDENFKSKFFVKVSSKLAKQGKLQEASEVLAKAKAKAVAKKTTGNWKKMEELVKKFTELDKQGKLENASEALTKAIEAAEKIKDDGYGSVALTEISTELAKLGKLKKAVALAEKITVGWMKSKAIIEISTELAKQGKLEDASEVLTKKIVVAEKITDDWRKSEALSKISTELAKQGKLEKAAAVAEKIANDPKKSKVLINIFTELAKQRKLEKAAAVREKITDSMWGNLVGLIEIYTKLAKQGELEDANEVFTKGTAVAEKITYEEDKPEALIKISTELARQGKFKDAGKVLTKAIAIAEKITNEWEKSKILIKISTELAKQGELEKAAAIRDKITNDWWRKLVALIEITVEVVEYRGFDRLAFAGEKISYKWGKSLALVKKSTELAKLGKLDEASEVLTKAIVVAEKITYEALKSKVLIEISTELARQGKLERATSIAEKIFYSVYKSEALSKISTELSKQGKLEDANEVLTKAIVVAEKTTDDWRKSRALIKISTELAKERKLGDASEVLTKAIAIAEKATNNWEKSKILVEISMELAKQGKLDEIISILELSPDRKTSIEIINKIIQNVEYAKLNEIESKLIKYLDTERLKAAAYYAMAVKISNQFNNELFYRLPEYSIKLFENLDYFSEILFGASIYLRFIKEDLEPQDKRLLKKLNEVIEISDWIDWEDEAEYSYITINDWINEIEDEDDRELVKLWARRVEKGKMAEEEFEKSVKELIK